MHVHAVAREEARGVYGAGLQSAGGQRPAWVAGRRQPSWTWTPTSPARQVGLDGGERGKDGLGLRNAPIGAPEAPHQLRSAAGSGKNNFTFPRRRSGCVERPPRRREGCEARGLAQCPEKQLAQCLAVPRPRNLAGAKRPAPRPAPEAAGQCTCGASNHACGGTGQVSPSSRDLACTGTRPLSRPADGRLQGQRRQPRLRLRRDAHARTSEQRAAAHSGPGRPPRAASQPASQPAC